MYDFNESGADDNGILSRLSNKMQKNEENSKNEALLPKTAQ
jgi:hypothetical protein